MSIPDHVEILGRGAEAWNQWRIREPKIVPDLSGADFSGATLVDIRKPQGLQLADQLVRSLIGIDFNGLNLYRANLRKTLLRGTNLRNAMLVGADLSQSDLSGAILSYARCRAVNFRGSKLSDANFQGSDLTRACLENAELRGANLMRATFVDADLTRADLAGARVYGISAWNVTLDEAKQSDLVITQEGESRITVDDLKLAQFTYLLLDNKHLRNVIDTISQKGVLILGRFTEERKCVLDSIRNKLRELDFVPMMFDFEKPTQRDFTETIKTLAGLSRFIIADITNPRSTPLELQATMPDYMVPFVPVIQEGEQPFSMFQDLKQKYGAWVLDLLVYDSADNLMQVLEAAVVRPALEKGQELLFRKADAIRSRHVRDYR